MTAKFRMLEITSTEGAEELAVMIAEIVMASKRPHDVGNDILLEELAEQGAHFREAGEFVHRLITGAVEAAMKRGLHHIEGDPMHGAMLVVERDDDDDDDAPAPTRQ